MPLSNPIFEEVANALSTEHPIARYNKASACLGAGYSIIEGPDGKALVSPRTPQPGLLDDDEQANEKDMKAERHRMVDAYADTLTRLGWAVERRGPRSRHPYLLVGHGPQA